MKQEPEVPVFKHDSIATIDESKLVEMLLTDPYWPSRIETLQACLTIAKASVA